MGEEDKGFKVVDRRRLFKEEAEVKEEAKGTREEPPAPNLISFILNLSTQAYIHFGDMPNPITNKKEKNLQMARQIIDLLGLLKVKTRGNLDAEEEKVLEGALYELRMRFVKETTK